MRAAIFNRPRLCPAPPFSTAVNKSGHFKEIEGLVCIAKLLRRPGKLVPMLQLVEGVASPPNRADLVEQFCGLDHPGIQPLGRHSHQEILDAKARKEYGERYSEIQAELSEAKRAGDPVKAERLKVELQCLADQLRASTGLRGSRELKGQIDNWRSTIYKRLSTAYTAMRKAQPPLSAMATHLENSISAADDSYCYDPSPLPDWTLD